MPAHGLMWLKDSRPPKVHRAGLRAGQPGLRSPSLPAACVQELGDPSGSAPLLSKGHSNSTNLARLPHHRMSKQRWRRSSQQARLRGPHGANSSCAIIRVPPRTGGPPSGPGRHKSSAPGNTMALSCGFGSWLRRKGLGDKDHTPKVQWGSPHPVVRTAVIREPTNQTHREGVGKGGPPARLLGYKPVQPLWRRVSRFPGKLQIELFMVQQSHSRAHVWRTHSKRYTQPSVHST